MKPKGLLIAAGLLVVLGGLVWWSNKKQAAKPSTDASIKVISIPENQFAGIRIKKLTDEVFDLKRENGSWTMTQPQLPADQNELSSMVTTLSNVTAEQVVEEKAGDLQPFGLHIPTVEVTITKKDGKTQQLLIGDDTPDGSGAYAKVAGDPRVFTVASSVKSAVDKREAELRDKRLLTFDPDKVTRVELQAKGQTVEFGLNGQKEWQIIRPRPLRADGSQIATLVDKLREARMDIYEPSEEAAKKFAAAARVATATVTDASGQQTLEIRKDKDNNFYARGPIGAYKTSADVGEELDKGIDDFRNKKVFDFGFSDPSKIDLKGGTSYSKSGDKWMSGAKAMDNSTVQNLIDKLRDLTASKFAETGGGEPVFEAAVTSNEGKRVEKVVVSKQGDRYFAKRENEPSIYELDAKAVEDLQKAAADVKEAPPQAKK